ncbi:peptidase M50 [Campylobacter geochelonis]|uniref:Peptidase M50 n=2 Tax=Campylobacter geochelonis TaxID=1780362 RepID=A0A128ER50_9BACT|nr:site-2 protease family protein [Campylobacter geochelonis]QKF71641.1 membrane-associated zinc metalloprotease, S2P/M50 family [Campylobacter geochelonis]CZE49382.1 peptidase M50 [Campylobacter geochelonis]CZE51551.1 peptidase M50 [Campylobacter geochelonis]
MQNLSPTQLLTLAVVLIISIVGHEIAHGYIAYKFGDNTAKNAGRLSLNPLLHVDIIGTILVPAILYIAGGVIFGWAKPVPINTKTVIQNGGYKAAILVSLAGICYNLVLAILSFLLLHFNLAPEYALNFIFMALTINIILAIFNLYPIPPLDGSHALGYLARMFGFNGFANFYDSLSKYSLIVIIVIIISPVGEYVFYPISQILKSIIALI